MARGRTPQTEAATAGRYEAMRAGWVALFRERFDDGPPPVDSETLGAIVVGLGLGAGVQRAFDPKLSGSTWVELLRMLLVPGARESAPAPRGAAR